MKKKKTHAAPVAPLLDLFRPSELDGELLSAVLTTYGLDLDTNFFEHDLLPTMFGLGGVRDRGYTAPVALERRLATSRVFLICDAHALATGGRPSLRVHVLPVSGITQHAKVFLIRRRRLVRLLVASANVTHAGFRAQREVFSVIDFRPDGAIPVAVLQEAVRGLRSALGKFANGGLEQELDACVRQVRAWKTSNGAGTPVSVVFGGGGEPGLWRRLVEAWPQNEAIEEWSVCSPFWPEPSGGQTPFEDIAAGLLARGASLDDTRLRIVADGDAPGPRAQPKFPFALVEQLRARGFPVKRGEIVAARVDALPDETPDGAEARRGLHAKWVLLRGRKTAVALVGSANFTRRGLGTATKPNIEADVLIKTDGDDLTFDRWAPPLAERRVSWESCTATEVATVDEEKYEEPPWPTFIRSIELEVFWGSGADPDGSLLINATPDAPSFDLLLPATEGDSLQIASVEQHRTDADLKHRSTVDSRVVARLLTGRTVLIRWGADARLASFPVNISEQSLAGLPSVLGAKPSEQQLLAYFHGRLDEDDLLSILEQRARQQMPGENGQTAVQENSRELQTYVVRDFVESLHGLEETLRSAATSARALEQAILGEFSPFAVAERIVEALRHGRRSPTAAAFQLAELLGIVASALGSISGDVMNESERADLEGRVLGRLFGLISVACGAGRGFREAAGGDEFLAYLKAGLRPSLVDRWRKTTAISAAIPVEQGVA